MIRLASLLRGQAYNGASVRYWSLFGKTELRRAAISPRAGFA
jgi:hypothetical protein